MLRFIAGLFIILHGLVHLLYTAHSLRRIEIREGLAWPDGSWAFSRLLGVEAARWLAASAYTLAAIGFVIGGLGIFLSQAWWRPFVVGSAVLSSISVLLLWDGTRQRLSDQGLFALLINVVIAVVALVVGAATLGF